MPGATVRDHGAPASGTPEREPGWRAWGRRRRALAAVTVVLWLLVAVLFAIALALEEVWVAAAALPLLALDWWFSGKRFDAEMAEQARAGIRSDPAPDELELRRELAQLDEREQDSLLLDKWLDDDPVVMRWRYPSRESLLVRSLAEAVELLGVGLVLVGLPSVWLVALGGLLWMAGGRSGAAVVGMLLDRRLHRTPVSDETRERWLAIEQRAVWAACAVLIVIAAIRLL